MKLIGYRRKFDNKLWKFDSNGKLVVGYQKIGKLDN
jgi:hypothetical protein